MKRRELVTGLAYVPLLISIPQLVKTEPKL